MEEPYYLVNFQFVLEDVLRRSPDLLSPGERDRAEAFRRLPPGARRLYVRMLTRRGPWFRRDALRYPEVDDLDQAIASLEAAGFCATSHAADPADLAGLLRKEEILDLLKEAGVAHRRSESREDLAGRLLADLPEARLRRAVDAAAPLGQDWARLLFMLFFGNGEQDLTDFVLADLGQVAYETYELDPACRIFETREEVDALRSLEATRAAFEAGADLEPLTAGLLGLERLPALRPQRRYHRLLNDVGRAWERRGNREAALACYRRSEVPPARERAARILAAQGLPWEAAEVALAMAGAPLDAGESQFAQRFLRRLPDQAAARWALAHPKPGPIPEVKLRVPRHPSGSVERAALEAAEGWLGFFTENALWNALYALAFWEVLFAPAPGAFQHRFQAAPADLGTPRFYPARREAIARRLEALEAPGAAARAILGTFEAKRGLANAFVRWKAVPREHLEAALGALPPAALLAFLREMAPSPWALRSGFPDLFLHREGQCMLWEVKGPGDALRPEQERWLGFFRRAGLDARVARVAYAD